jgi:hypothetical protein
VEPACIGEVRLSPRRHSVVDERGPVSGSSCLDTNLAAQHPLRKDCWRFCGAMGKIGAKNERT